MTIVKSQEKKFDKVDVMNKHLDVKIDNMIKLGKDLDGIIEDLKISYDKFEKIMYSCGTVDARFRYIYTHNKLVDKLIVDIDNMKYILSECDEFSNYSISKIISLMKFRNKIIGDPIVVNVPESIKEVGFCYAGNSNI